MEYNYLLYNSSSRSLILTPNSISNTASVTFNFSGSNFQPFLTTASFFVSSSLGISNSASITSLNTSSLTTTLYSGVEYFITYKPNQWNPSSSILQTFDTQISAIAPVDYIQTDSPIVGQIFYPHGIATFTTGGLENMASYLNYYFLTGSGYGVGDYGNNIYGVAPTRIYPYLFPSTISFMSSYRIYENQYKFVL